MAKKNVSQVVEEMAKPIVQNLGYELVETKYCKQNGAMALTLFIYSKDGITIDDCEKVSNALNEPLDALNPTGDEPYALNISSLGLDRPIKNIDDAGRDVGKEINVKLYVPQDGKKLWTGILTAFDDESITIKFDSTEKIFKFNQIALASPVIKF